MLKIEEYLNCIDCQGDLKQLVGGYKCAKCNRKYGFKNNIFDCMGSFKGEKLFSKNKWDEYYKNSFKGRDIIDDYKRDREMYQNFRVDQIKKYYKLDKSKVFMELGCGVFIIGGMLAKDCKLVVGIDFSMPSLIAARKILDHNGVKNYLLIHGDIFKVPLKSKSIDLLYGGGVIEHFKDTNGCVAEFGRIMKKGGVALNAVPMLNIGSLTYRQIWGNIPDFPVIKQFAEWLHIKILKGKHMYFGYELSFTQSKLKKIHLKNGFTKINFVRFDTEIIMGFLPEFMKPAMRYLAKNYSWFWPMMLVVAKK